MVLNYIWVGLFLIGSIVSIVNFSFFGDINVFTRMVDSTFEYSKKGFEFALGLVGLLTLWLGLLKIGENSGLIRVVSKLIAPFFKRLFPEIPKDHPVHGQIFMNFSANMLGLDNAATPIGLKAMQQMQELNPNKETASNAQIMFLTLNASGLTLIPITIMAARSSAGATNPTDVFVPILLATFCSTLAGLISVSIYQKINLFDRVIFPVLLGVALMIAGILFYFKDMDKDRINTISTFVSNLILFGVIIFFIGYAFLKKINVYDSFIEGAKEGFETAIKVIPYVIAILVAVGVFRVSGAMDLLMDGLGAVLSYFNIRTDFLPALPTALMKPLSGSGSRGMMIETMTTYGPNTFPAFLASVFQGAADTTFYILTVYFGYVGVKHSRYALKTCLIADLAGVIAAIFIAYVFFG